MTLNTKNNSAEDNGAARIDDEDYLLVQRFKGGDKDSFNQLVGKHKDKVRNLVYLTLGDSDYVDDISQDVFISVFYKLEEFRFESKFTTWLYRITVNKCRDYLRKKRVRSIFIPIKDNEAELSTGGFRENIDLPGLVRKGIQKLPEKLKIPLILRDIEGLSYKEIADKLDCEVGTVKSRIFRARESLKLILQPYQNELES